jgi:hypothetical protein
VCWGVGWPASNTSLQQPNVTINIVTQNGFLSLPVRRWSDGTYVVGFRAMVVTLTQGPRARTHDPTSTDIDGRGGWVRVLGGGRAIP